jgi:hypothetical protein
VNQTFKYGHLFIYRHFGPDDREPLLGVTALESVGITVDPANRQLKRLPAIPLK